MKIEFASAAFFLALMAAAPSQAAVMVVGQGQTLDCFQAAADESHASLSMPARRDALASCNAALADKIMAADRTATLANRGVLEAAAGNVDDAIADYNAALARKPQLASVYIDRGSAYLRAQRFTDARADFDHALSLDVQGAHIAYFDRGVAEEKLGDLVAAYHDYRQAQALAPDFKPAALELARFHVVDRQYADRH